MSQKILHALQSALLSLPLLETSAHEYLVALAKRPRLRDVEIRADSIEVDARGRVMALADAQATIDGEVREVPLLVEAIFDGADCTIEDLAVDEEEFLQDA
jgi:hypothetical protein